MKFIIFIPFFLAPLFSFADPCIPKVGSCGFYACEEKRHHCGPRGYPLGYGFKFCQVFLNTEREYSLPAKSWLRRVRVCLMESFKRVNGDTHKTCRKVKNDSFRSHIGCYKRTGFCDLRSSDRLQIIWALRNSVIYPEAIRDGLAVMETCALKTELNQAARVELR